MKILFYGTESMYDLCKSYMRSAENRGHSIQLFDFEKSVLQNINYGKIGLKIHQHFSPENWIQKINRQFVIMARKFEPDVILVFTNAPISPSALMFLKSVLRNCKNVLIWPDALLNFKDRTMRCLPLYDLIATYGSTSVPLLKSYAGVDVEFVPLAGDPSIHGMAPGETILRDVGFVGGWRPERQKSLEIIANYFPNLLIEISGPEWKEKCRKTILQNKVTGSGLRGKAMAEFFNSSRININTIDETNYPSANMRFFEIPTAGGLQLASSCPEMENTFQDRKHILYYNNDERLIEQIQWILDHPGEVMEIKFDSHQLILQGHTYDHRLQSILANFQ